MKNCLVCGEKIPSYNTKFCSRKCYLTTRIKKQVFCLVCNKELTKWQKIFCSSSCAAIYNNKNKMRKKKEWQTTKCFNCNEKIKYTKYKKKYCSMECQTEQKTKVLLSKWFENNDAFNYLPKVPQIIRTYLFKLHDNKCQICSWGEINTHTQKIPLEVHHINGLWWDNSPENLQLLCPNCHALTDNYKAANVGKTKVKTNKRGRGYKNGRHGE